MNTFNKALLFFVLAVTFFAGSAQAYESSPQEYFVETPEPASVLLLGLGLLAILGLKMRKNSAIVRV